jgi:hypothetical protein
MAATASLQAPRHVLWRRAMGMILSRKLLTRYRELKQDVPDCLLLMQVGAFMQVMDQDAWTVSQVTGLKLQMAGDQVQIAPRGTNQYSIQAEGTGADLTGFANAVTVMLTIGDDRGTTSVTADIQ